MQNKILIIGGNHQNPLGVIEALGQKGLRPYVIINCSNRSSFVLKSKYIQKGWICTTDDETVNCILKNFCNTSDKTVVITCNDNMASLLSDHYDKFKDFLIIPGINRQGAVSEWMDKEKMSEAAESIGLSIPKSWLVSKNNMPSDIEFPCVTKSLTSVKNGKSEFTICNNQKELNDFVATQAHSGTIQVQQFIDKEFEFQYLGCSLNGGEEIIIPGRTHIDVTTHFNNLTFLRYQKDKVVADSETLSKTEDFIRMTGYSGLFSVEFMHGKDGKDYFLEMNFRNDGNGIVVTASGTNLPYIWYLYNTGGDYVSEIKKSVVKETYSVPEDSYFISMLQGDMTYREWRRNMKKANCYLSYFKGDTKPFWALMWLQKRAILASMVIYVLRKLRLHK